jgi:hypothetical protein
MKFFICNQETGNNKILLEKSAWTGKSSLYINGKAMKKMVRNSFSFYDSEGKEKKVQLKGNEIFGIEMLMDGRSITILRKLNVFEIILSLIPVVLIFFGGAIGGACAAVGIMIIATFCRKMDNIIVKIIFSLGIYGLITFACLLLVELYFKII